MEVIVRLVVQSLNGVWELRQVGLDEVIAASVPGCVHLDLMSAGKIDDPFKGDNEYTCAWVHEADWEYARSFDVAGDLLDADKILLECDGLDTIADVVFNGRLLGRVENMYVRHEFDVTDVVKRGSNTLQITFLSPVNFVKPLVDEDPLICPTDMSIPGAVYTRKSPCQWGWDWGPKLPSSGIWRDIRLVGYRVAKIDGISIRQEHQPDGSAAVDVEVFVRELCMSFGTLRALDPPLSPICYFQGTALLP